MTVTDSSLENLMKRNPFQIVDSDLQLTVDVEDYTLKGIFKFDVQVTDLGQFFTVLVSCKNTRQWQSVIVLLAKLSQRLILCFVYSNGIEKL
jgi:hypothetical protein